jgi:NADH-quinone oxidoreductase subunit A
MWTNYIPIFIFFVVAVGFALTVLLLSAIFGKRKITPQKMLPYECGMDPIGEARNPFSVKFYIIAMLFIIFDIEAVFLYPWAVIFKDLRIFGLAEMAVFIGILLIGFIYIWKKGALEWE